MNLTQIQQGVLINAPVSCLLLHIFLLIFGFIGPAELSLVVESALFFSL